MAAAAASDAAHAGVLRRLWGAYNAALYAHPLKTKIVTSGFCLATGDFIAQRTEHGRAIADAEKRGETASTFMQAYDWWRGLRFMSFGAIIHGPGCHWWFEALDKHIYPRDAATKMRGPLVKLFMDKAILTPLMLILFYAYTQTVQLKPEGFYTEMEDKFWPSMCASWAFWSPLMLFVYWKVPLEHRLLAVNGLSIIWNALLSAISAVPDLSTFLGWKSEDDKIDTAAEAAVSPKSDVAAKPAAARAAERAADVAAAKAAAERNDVASASQQTAAPATSILGRRWWGAQQAVQQ